MTRLAVRRPRPQKLSDPHFDFTPDSLRRLLAVPDDQMEFQHFKSLLGPFLPAGTYEESVYFLPRAFDYLLAHDDCALDLCTSLIWFTSEYAKQLRSDKLLNAARDRLWDCLARWTANFSIIHFDEPACREKGWKVKYFDYVRHQEVVCQATCDLVEFDQHQDIAVRFTKHIADHGGDATRAAWFLEYARSNSDVYHPPNHPAIQQIVTDRALLAHAASVVVGERLNKDPSPSYWDDTFKALDL